MKQLYKGSRNENIRNLRFSGIGYFLSNLWTTANNLGTQYAVSSPCNRLHMANMGCNRPVGYVGSWTCGLSEEQITLQD